MTLQDQHGAGQHEDLGTEFEMEMLLRTAEYCRSAGRRKRPTLPVAGASIERPFYSVAQLPEKPGHNHQNDGAVCMIVGLPDSVGCPPISEEVHRRKPGQHNQPSVFRPALDGRGARHEPDRICRACMRTITGLTEERRPVEDR